MTEYLRAERGPAFGGSRHTRRPRIAGCSDGTPWPHAMTQDTRRLSWLEPLVVDADACEYQGRPLQTGEDFWRVIRADDLSQVEGAFSLAWLERDAHGAKRLNLARDAIGHRTLYYTQHEGRLFFASSLYALQRLHAELTLNLRAIAAYLSCAYVPGRETISAPIHELLPGELVSFSGGQLERRKFWQLPSEPRCFDDEQPLAAALRARLEREVQRLLPAEGEVAASLSGGVDSSLVVALLARLHGPVRTYSISFGAKYPNELSFSSLVAAHTQSRHLVLELTPQTVLAHLDDTMGCLDKPNGDPLTVPNALLFRAMGEHATVTFNGEGGDPCFGGPKNLPMILSELYDGDDDTRATTREQSYLRAHLKCFDDLPELLAPHALEAARTPPLEDDVRPWFGDARYHTLVGRLMAINVDWKGGHHILPKLDALSAPFGVLPRSPLFARSIVESAFAIPSSLKLRGSIEKYLLKRAVADLLPAPIIERAKSGMMVPVEGWFKGALLPEARARILDGLAPYGLFQRAKLEELVAGHSLGLRPRRGVKLWLLVTLEAHLRALKRSTHQR